MYCRFPWLQSELLEMIHMVATLEPFTPRLKPIPTHTHTAALLLFSRYQQEIAAVEDSLYDGMHGIHL